MKISALEVVGKLTGVSSHGLIVMKIWGHGSWCRGKKGLLEHMATMGKYPQPLQNLHFLEVQWMWMGPGVCWSKKYRYNYNISMLFGKKYIAQN